MAEWVEPTTDSFRDLYIKVERCRQVLEQFQDGSAHVLECVPHGDSWGCDIETGRHGALVVADAMLVAYLALLDTLAALGFVVPAPDPEPDPAP